MTVRKIYHYVCARTIYSLIAYTLIFTANLYSQNNPYSNLRFERISSENFKIEKGLSQNSVNCIYQDTKGFMWFGTWDGLNKYDGYNFIVYKATSGKSKLSNQTVNTIFEDNKEMLWIGTETGLNYFNRHSGEFIHFFHNPDNPSGSICSDSITCITQDMYGNLWVGTQNGLDKFSFITGKLSHYVLNPQNANSLSNNTINDLYADNNGLLWIATNNGVNILKIKTDNFKHLYNSTTNSNSLCNDKVICIEKDKNDSFWFGTINGLSKYNTTNHEFSNYYNQPNIPSSLSNNKIGALLIDKDGKLWIGTNGGGLNMYNAVNNNFIRYNSNPNDNSSLSDDYICSLFEDNSGIIWIGTTLKGVNKLDKNAEKFFHYQHVPGNDNSLNCNIVWSIVLDDDNLLVATNEGINIIDRNNNKYSLIQNIPGSINSLVNNQTRRLLLDSKGNLWIGTFGYGADKYNTKTKQFTHFQNHPLDSKSLTNNIVWCFLEDKNKNIWIGTENGLNKYIPKTNNFEIFKNIPGNSNSLSHNSILSLYEDNFGKIWISTYKGLNIYNPENGQFSHLFHQPDNPNSLNCNFIFSVTETKNGLVWICTMGGGLNCFDPVIGKFTHYTENEGLANNVVYDLVEDKKGILWISTNYGISRFNPNDNSFINYDVKEGVQGNEFNLGAACHNKETDEIFFGGMNGFNSFIPEKVKKNPYIPPIVISSFKVFDKVKSNEINYGDTIFLSYYDNFFSFEFSSLDYTDPSKNKYAYKLENFDKNWNYCDAYKRFAGYTKVNPGTYIFRVKGSNSDGTWNSNGTYVTIIISPPWWANWWFRVTMALVIIFSIWYIIYMRWRNVKIKHEDEKRILQIEKQMFELEQTALRLQINPHFIFNTLNSIQSFVISNDTDRAINYLAKFAQLMRLILSNSHQTYVPISDEIKALTYYLDIERLRFNNKFLYNIVIDPDIDVDFMEIPPMIIQPYLENAILHGILNKVGDGNILISMKKNDNSILITVQDDGIGREKASEIRAKSDLGHKSKGMLITQKRLEILNKQNKDQMSVIIIDLKNQSNEAIGTKVEILILYKDI